MTRETAKIKVELLDNYLSHTCQDYGERDHEAMMMAIKALEQEPVLDKIREQIMSNLKGVDIALEVLGENHPLRQKMEGAKDTLVDCLELIDKAESENP